MLIYLLDMNVIKNISILKRFCLLAALMCTMAACSDEEEAVAPSFPEQEIVEAVTPGTAHTLSFTANLDWKVTSSALWCKFSNGLTSISGEAGEVSLPLTISDEAWSVNELTVDITLIMGNEEKVIARYIRTGKDLAVMDVDGNAYNAENKLTLSYVNNDVINGTFSVVTNFAWELKDAPEWLAIDLPLKVKANQKFDLSVQLNNGYLTEVQEGVLRFYEQNSDRYYDVPVCYSGMPEGVIRVDGLGSAWNWTVSLDGSQYWQAALTEGDEDVEKKFFPLSFNVLAQNNEYVIRCLGEENGWMNIDENLFYQCKDDQHGNLTLSDFQENGGAKRKGYILAFPKKDYDEISHQGTWPDCNTLLDASGKDVSEDVIKYVIMSFEQEGTQTSSVAPVKVNVNGEGDVEATQGLGNIMNPDVLDAISQLYFADEANKNNYIFNYSVPAGSFVTITPYIKNYFGENAAIGSCELRTFSNPYESNTSIEVNKEGETYEDSNVYFMCGDEPLIVIFKDENMMICKVLILNVE